MCCALPYNITMLLPDELGEDDIKLKVEFDRSDVVYSPGDNLEGSVLILSKKAIMCRGRKFLHSHHQSNHRYKHPMLTCSYEWKQCLNYTQIYHFTYRFTHVYIYVYEPLYFLFYLIHEWLITSKRGLRFWICEQTLKKLIFNSFQWLWRGKA